MRPSSPSRARHTGPRSFRWSISTIHLQAQRRALPAGILDGCIACDGCGAPALAPAGRQRAARKPRVPR